MIFNTWNCLYDRGKYPPDLLFNFKLKGKIKFKTGWSLYCYYIWFDTSTSLAFQTFYLQIHKWSFIL